MTYKEQLRREIQEAQEKLAQEEAEERRPRFRVTIKAEVVWVDYLKADTREEAEDIAKGKFGLPDSEISDGSDMEITNTLSIEADQVSDLPCPRCSESIEPQFGGVNRKSRCVNQDLYCCSKCYGTFVVRGGKLERAGSEIYDDKTICPACSGPTKRITIAGYSRSYLCEACNEAFSIADTTVSENVKWSAEIRCRETKEKKE